MDFLMITLVTVLASALTFFSGFGLGTLLLPVFVLFFPLQIAIAATAVVHLANNVFKAVLVGNKADWGVLARFAIPAAGMAILGALLLDRLNAFPVLYRYQLGEAWFAVTLVKVLVAGVMLLFAMIEFLPVTKNLAFHPKWVPVGGAVSGFFGGLSGHQGALRAAFLVRLGLNKDTFIGTTILSAIVIDISRLLVYGVSLYTSQWRLLFTPETMTLVIAGILAALVGAIWGNHYLKKVTLEHIHRLIAVLLVLYALALGVGLI